MPLGGLSQIALQIAGSAVTAWVAAPRVHCGELKCPVQEPVSEALVEVLREQLARCGPANLTRVDAVKCHCDTSVANYLTFWLAVALVFCSVALGVLIGVALERRRSSESPLPSRDAPAKVEPAGSQSAPSTPSTLRALRLK